MITFLSLFLCGIFLVYLRYYYRRQQDPPGPIGIPVIGSLFAQAIWANSVRNTHFFNYLLFLKKKYGDITSMQVGAQKYIVLHSMDVIKEAYIKHGDTFSGRPTNAFYKLITDDVGVVSIEGEMWKSQRRFCLHTLRDFGFGKLSLEKTIIQEADYIVDIIDSHKNQPIMNRDVIVKGVVNIISKMIFNKRFDYDDPTLNKYLKSWRTLTNVSETPNYLMFIPLFFPCLAKKSIMLRLKGMSTLIESKDFMKSVITKEVRDHWQTFNAEEDANDFVDAFFKQMSSLDDDLGRGNHEFTIEQCIGLCQDMISAGTDTTATTISWALFMLAVHPQIQQKLHQEIDQFIPCGRNPTMDDRKQMVYLQSVIDEVNRLCTVTPQLVHRRVVRPIMFRNYRISPDDIIVVNTFGVHKDPALFENPEEFKPERFIDANGNYKPSENVIPFGLGRRHCLGENLAKMETFLILCYLMQRYRVEIDPADEDKFEDIISGTDGIIHSPGNHKILFTKRQIQ